MDAEQHQMAADPWTKPTDLSHWPAFRLLRNYIHHRHHYIPYIMNHTCVVVAMASAIFILDCMSCNHIKQQFYGLP